MIDSLFNNIKKYSLIFSSLIWLIFFYIYLVKYFATNFIQDDAFTSLRYVKNFVNGNGLVFNINEKVEGYTNFLWVMLLSFIAFISDLLKININLETTTTYLSTAFGFIFLVSVFLLAKKILTSIKSQNIIINSIPFVVVLMILNTTPFIYWSVSGMETSLFATLTILSILFFIDIENNYIKFAIVASLNSLLRPEGLLYFIILLFLKIILDYLTEPKIKLNDLINKSFDKNIKIATFIFVIIQIIYLLFRLVYYGYPLPNTFYAKTEFSLSFLERGFNYFTKYFLSDLFYGIVLIPTLFRIITRNNDKYEYYLFFFSIIYLILTILIGGDVLPIGRFYIPITPLFYICFFYSLYKLIENYLLKYNISLYSIIVFLTSVYSFLNFNNKLIEMVNKRSYEIGLVSKMKVYADWINKYFPENNGIALSTIGAFSFYNNSKVIDLVGLTDVYIAHNPKEVEGINDELPILWQERHYNADYILSKKPDFIIFPAGAKPSAFAEFAIFVNDEFYKNYYVQIFQSKDFNQILPIYTRKENIRNVKTDCDIKYLKHFINLNNLFLKVTETKKRELLNKLLNEADLVLQYCPNHISNVNALKGMSFFLLGNFNIAKKYLENAVKYDNMNSVALFYLINTYYKLNDVNNAFETLIKLKKISPYVFVDFYN